MRTLFDAFGLTVTYDSAGKPATVEVTVDDGTLPGVEAVVAAVTNTSQGELGISLAPLVGHLSNPEFVKALERLVD